MYKIYVDGKVVYKSLNILVAINKAVEVTKSVCSSCKVVLSK